MAYADYEWFIQKDVSKYAGKWIAIINKEVVAEGKSLTIVLKEAKEKYPKLRPLLTKVRNKLAIL